MIRLRQLAVSVVVTVTIALFSLTESYAQAPQAVNYQAVARDTSGQPLANQSIDVEFTIIDSTLGTSVYSETWPGTTTNRFGLFALQIGRGTTTNDFSTIDWDGGSMYLQVNIDGVDMGAPTELVSVPYAIYADEASFADSAGNALVIDSAQLVGSSYVLYTNRGNDTTSLASISGTSLDSVHILGINSDTMRFFQGNDTLDIDVGIFSSDNDESNEKIDTIAFINNPNKVFGFVEGGDTSVVSLRALSDSIAFEALDGFDLKLVMSSNLNDTSIISLSQFATVSQLSDTANNIRADLNTHVDDDNDTSATNELIISGTLSGTDLDIVDAGGTTSIDITPLTNDTSATNELITSGSLNGTDIDIVDAGGTTSIDVTPLTNDTSATNELITSGSLNGTDIDIVDAGGTTSIDVTPLTNDTSATNELITSGSLNGTDIDIVDAGGTTSIDVTPLTNDTSATNELITSGSLNGADIDIVDAGGTTSIDVTPLTNDTSTTNEIQTFSFNGLTNTLSLSNGGGSQVIDSDSTNELQNLSINGDTIFISDGNNVVLPATAVNLDNDPTNELQVITYNDTLGRIRLSNNGGQVAIDTSDINEIQTFSFNGLTNTLSLSNGGGSQVIDSDSTNELQNLSINGDTIFISDGNNVVLPGSSSTGTPQRLAFFADNDSLASFDDFFIDTTNNRIGFGMFNPQAKLCLWDSVGSGTSIKSYSKGGQSGTLNGIYSEIEGLGGSGDSTIGVRSRVYGSNEIKIGFQSYVRGGSTNRYYGIYNDVDGGDINFGTYNRVVSPSGSDSTIAVYGDATGNGNNIYSGYFNRGDVYVNDTLKVGVTVADQRLDVDGGARIDSVFVDSLVINGNYVLPLDAPTITGQVISYDGTSVVWDTVASTMNTTDTLSRILANSSDANQDSILNLNTLETGILSADKGDVDTLNATNINFTDTLDGQYAIINRIDGDTINMNFASIGTVSSQSVLSDSVTVDSLIINGIKFPDHTGANPNDILTYTGVDYQWLPVAGDNLGNHTLDSNLRTNGFYLSNDGDNEGVFVDATGKVGIGTNAPFRNLDVVGNALIDTLFTDSLVINNIAFPRPDTAVANEVLTFQNGKMIWKAGAGGGDDNDWDTSATSVFTTTRTVGIGTASPAASLDIVNTDSNFTLNLTNSTNSATDKKTVFATVTGGGTGDAYAVYAEANAATGDKYGVYGSAAGAGSTKYGVYGTASGAGTNFAGFFENGNVHIQEKLGIGVTNPGAPLVVQPAAPGNFQQNGIYVNNTNTGSTDAAYVTVRTANGAGEPVYSLDIDGKGGFAMAMNQTDTSLNFYSNPNPTGPEIMTLTQNDKVGIGNTNPSVKLDVIESGADTAVSFNIVAGENGTVVTQQNRANALLNANSTAIGLRSEAVNSTKKSIAFEAIATGTDTVIGVYGNATDLGVAGAEFAGYFDNGAVYISDSLILPNGASNGFVLTSDAAGNASWAAAGSSPWSSDADTIFTLTDQVGISTSSPLSPLHVDGNIRGRGVFHLGAEGTNNEGAQIRLGMPFDSLTNVGPYWDMDVYADSSFRIFTQGNGVPNVPLQIEYHSEHVGIGLPFNVDADSMLTVNGGIKGESIQLTHGANDGYVLTSDANGSASWQPGGADDDWQYDTVGTSGIIYNLDDSVSIGTSTASSKFNVLSDGETAAVISLNGSTVSPSRSLTVVNQNSGATVNTGVQVVTNSSASTQNIGALVTADSSVINLGFGAFAGNIADAGNTNSTAILATAISNNGTVIGNRVIATTTNGEALGDSIISQSSLGKATGEYIRTVSVSDSSIGILSHATSITNKAIGLYSTATSTSDSAFAAIFDEGFVEIRDTLILPNGAAAGRVLTSDANGVARWDTIATTVDTCPAGYAAVNDKFCIMETPVLLNDWYDAADSCALDDAKLPSWSEWYQGRAATGVTNYGTVWEWVDQLSQNNASIVGGTGLKSRAADNPEAPTNTLHYRCVYYKN